MNTPPARRWTGSLRDSSLHHKWRVRAQLRLALDSGEKDCRPGALPRLFPAPLPVNPLRYDPARHAKADYRNVGKAFWADEHNNKP